MLHTYECPNQIEVTCQQCHRTFQAHGYRQDEVKFCTRGCYTTFRRKDIRMVECACGCGAELLNRNASRRKLRFIYGHNARTRKHTPETRAKISAYVKAHPVRYWLGKNVPHFTGANHPLWKGGITPENLKIRAGRDIRQWRKAVLERDNYTCLLCRSQIDLEVHHIKRFADYPQLRFEVTNGATLCSSCHDLNRGIEPRFEELFAEMIRVGARQVPQPVAA